MIRIKYSVVNCLFGLMLLSACDKDHLFDCLKNTGSIVTETRTVSEFNRIDVYNNVNVIITQDTENAISVEAGSQIISGITTELSDGVLTIRNENKCNWVRSYSTTIVVHVHAKRIDFIHQHGSALISSANQLKCSTLDLNVWNSGNISLDVAADSIYSRQHTTVGDITLKGQTNYCFAYNNGNGFTYESNLQVIDGVVIQRGTGDCYVNMSQTMDVEIHDSGNIYYMGSPRIRSTITGSGRLIQQ